MGFDRRPAPSELRPGSRSNDDASQPSSSNSRLAQSGQYSTASAGFPSSTTIRKVRQPRAFSPALASLPHSSHRSNTNTILIPRAARLQGPAEEPPGTCREGGASASPPDYLTATHDCEAAFARRGRGVRRMPMARTTPTIGTCCRGCRFVWLRSRLGPLSTARRYLCAATPVVPARQRTLSD